MHVLLENLEKYEESGKCVFMIPAIVISWCIYLSTFLAYVRTYAFFTWHF